MAGAALIGAAVSFSSSTVNAQQAAAPAAGAHPVGHRCVVTLDPTAARESRHDGETMKKTGLTPEVTVEGTLVSIDNDWLILKDGTYENWIPRDKVLFMRVSR